MRNRGYALLPCLLLAVTAAGQLPPGTPAENGQDAYETAVAGPPSESDFESTEPPTVELFPGEHQPGEVVEKGPASTGFSMEKLQDEYDRLEGAEAGMAGGEPGSEAARGEAPWVLYAKTLGLLCLVLASIVLVLHLVRKIGRRTRLLAGGNLATVLGRVYLTDAACLHFVRAGNKVLVLGVTRSGISLVTEFDATAFEREAVERPEQERGPDFNSFLADLTPSARATDEGAVSNLDEGDIESLRGEIQRLKRSIQESPSDSEE